MPELDSVRGGRVLLVEDDVQTSGWLASVIAEEGSLELVAVCASVAQSLAWLACHEADFALVDLGLPDGSGLRVIGQLAARHPRCEVLVLSVFGDEHNVLAAIAAGAGGYLLKDGELGRFGDHLNCLRTGGSPLSPSIARTLIELHRQPRAPMLPVAEGPAPRLSERELEVLTGISKGFTYGEVAAALGITTNTVRTHIRHLYEKLAVNSSGEAVYEYNRLMRERGRSTLP